MVYAVDVYDKNGKLTSKFDLNPELFSDEIVNPSLIHEYLLLQQANARNVIASTKTRAEVAGSGRTLARVTATNLSPTHILVISCFATTTPPLFAILTHSDQLKQSTNSQLRIDLISTIPTSYFIIH